MWPSCPSTRSPFPSFPSKDFSEFFFWIFSTMFANNSVEFLVDFFGGKSQFFRLRLDFRLHFQEFLRIFWSILIIFIGVFNIFSHRIFPKNFPIYQKLSNPAEFCPALIPLGNFTSIIAGSPHKKEFFCEFYFSFKPFRIFNRQKFINLKKIPKNFILRFYGGVDHKKFIVFQKFRWFVPFVMDWLNENDEHSMVGNFVF